MRQTRYPVFLDAEGGVWIADEYGGFQSVFIALRRRDPDEVVVLLSNKHEGDYPPVTYWGPCPLNATEMEALSKAIEAKKAALLAA